MEKAPSTRLNGIDTFRLIGFFAVVTLHARAVAGYDWHLAVDQLSRFAVPFYFIVSGYFLNTAPEEWWHQIKRSFVRIAPVLLVWIVVYTMESPGFLKQIHDINSAVGYICGTWGPGFHLWFLAVLIMTIPAFIVLRRFGAWAPIAVGILLYFAGLAIGPYKHIIGLDEITFEPRNVPFFSLLFVSIGVLARNAKAALPVWGSAGLIALGIVLQFIECWLIYTHKVDNAWYPQILVGTVPFAAGVFFLALKLPNTTGTDLTASIGRLTLWLYCVHLTFLHVVKLALLKAHMSEDSAPYLIVAVILIVALSVVSALAADRVKFLRLLTR